MNETPLVVHVPEKVLSSMGRYTYMTYLLIVLGMLPLAAASYLGSSATGVPTTSAIEHRNLSAAYLYSGLAISFGCMFVARFVGLRIIATRISALVHQSTGNAELSRILRKRMTKTFFLSITGEVPMAMRLTRLSATPNADGSYWMMKTGRAFSTLDFQKYHRGEVAEPTDPDSKEAKYPWLSKSNFGL